MSKTRGPLRLGEPVAHPFTRVMPKAALAVSIAVGGWNSLVRLAGGLWPWRRELMLTTLAAGGWWAAARWLATWWALAAIGVVGSGLALTPRLRRGVVGWLRCGRTARLVRAGFRETRAGNVSGRLPRIARVVLTPVGEQIRLKLRPGQSAELLDARVEELRAAAQAREVRVTKDPNRADRVLLDVVRRDPLAASADVAWLDQHAQALSMWDPVHLGLAETGRPVRLSLVERSLLVGGEPGSGKSSLLNLVVAHAAKSAGVQMVLIDPNEVQFGPWKNRALAYASDDPGEALEAVELVRAEVRRRLALLNTLPGVVRKVTPEIAAQHGLPLWVLVIDELAFHTSVVGSTNQRAAFNTAARDVVARCRAAGVIPLMATQRPTSDVVPTSLRDLFSLRCSFRTTTATSSDVILGDSWARRGFSGTDIDITARGVGWLLAEGDQPQRIKVAWLPDETIAALAASTAAQHQATNTPPATPTPTPAPVPVGASQPRRRGVVDTDREVSR